MSAKLFAKKAKLVYANYVNILEWMIGDKFVISPFYNKWIP